MDSLSLKLINACNCTSSIESTSYKRHNEYDGQMNWSEPPIAITGGISDINAALLGVNDTGIILAFRGTLSDFAHEPLGALLDWIQDILTIKPIEVLGIKGKVHQGFYDAVNSIWGKIEVAVMGLHKKYPDKKLYITGHSKGGAMATIAAALFHAQTSIGIEPTGIYTYAAPRPGDKTFSASYPYRVFRYEYIWDLVPYVPPSDAWWSTNIYDDSAWIFSALAKLIKDVGWLKAVSSWFQKEKSTFKAASECDYSPVGELQFIADDLSITSGGVLDDIWHEGVAVYDDIKGDKKAVAFDFLPWQAHDSGDGYAYMKAIKQVVANG